MLLRTQDLPPVYEENSNLYLFTADQIAAGRRIGKRPILFEIDPLEAVDIDEEADFVLAEALDRHLAERRDEDRRHLHPADPRPRPAPGQPRGVPACRSSVPVIAGQHLEGDELVAALDGCVGVIAGDDRFTADVLDRCPDLRVISKWGIGIDGIDLAAAAARGIIVTNTPGVFDDEVADVTMAYLVMLARGLHIIDRGVHAGAWPKPAGHVAARRDARHRRSRRHRPRRRRPCRRGGDDRVRRRPLARVGRRGRRRSACPSSRSPTCSPPATSCRSTARSTPETFHLFDAAGVRPHEARRLPRQHRPRRRRRHRRPRRRPHVSGRLAGAALDVMEEEPPGPESPLLGRPDVIFGSHNASNTLQASARVHVMAIENLVRELGVTVTP